MRYIFYLINKKYIIVHKRFIYATLIHTIFEFPTPSALFVRLFEIEELLTTKLVPELVTARSLYVVEELVVINDVFVATIIVFAKIEAPL